MKGITERTAEVLVVGDCGMQAERLYHGLAEAGYHVRTATSGLRALESLRVKPAEVVISDAVLPGMDGYRLCRAIKDDSPLRDIPVILLTPLSDTEDVLQSLTCAADNFITKLCDVGHLLSRLRSVLTDREQHPPDRTQPGLEIHVGGRTLFVTADRQQILNLLVAALQRLKPSLAQA
jgi:DNA-binding response OmpR family regulator